MHLTHRVCLLSSPLSSPTPPNSYTFDRLGNAFRRGVVVHVSILPLLIAIIPTWIAAVALVIIHARKCCCSGEKEDAGAITVARPQAPGAVGELARVGGRRLLRGRRERAVLQLFRIIEEEGEDDAEEGGDEGSGKGCCKSLMLRRLWRSMTE